MLKKDQDRFYAKGLQFECLGCGRCCTGFPGYVYLSEGDIRAAAGYLRAAHGSFIEKYTRVVAVFNERRLSLTEKKNDHCIFWDDGCSIYPARPYQCRTFPFWERQLVSKGEWEKASGGCPGINRGRVYSKEEIERCVNRVPNYNLDRFTSSPGFDPLTRRRP